VSNRFSHIDFLRAVCILGFIVIHVFSYTLSSSFNNFVWNWLHFVVGGFVFCSGYVISKYQKTILVKKNVVSFYKKRLVRLLVPYYIYLFIHTLLLFVFPQYFSGIGITRSMASIISSALFLEGGTNFSWLPLLFVELTILFPFIAYIFGSKKLKFTYTFLALLVTFYFSVVVFPYNLYRLVMWIPWSLLFLAGMWFYKKDTSASSVQVKKNSIFPYVITTVFSWSIFFVIFQTWILFHKKLNIIDNKYPPNLYDLSYETFGTFFLLSISSFKLFNLKKVQSIFRFLSEQSYSIFFIHIILLDFILHFKLNVYVQLLFVLILSIVISGLGSGLKLANQKQK